MADLQQNRSSHFYVERNVEARGRSGCRTLYTAIWAGYTCFHMDVPISGTSETGEFPMRGHLATSLRVLIVDDSVDTASSLGALLRLWGHNVELAHDGLSAIEAAASFRPEAVILDIGLPQLDGFEVASRLRACPEFEGMLIVGSSGYSRESDRRRANEVGIDVYLVKPFDPFRLESILESHRVGQRSIPA